MIYSVQKLATLAGVSVRTLHYYDEIGLLKPSFFGANGYRFYQDDELIKLQQILFFRELEFPLQQIQIMMSAADFDRLEALEEQKKLLRMKQKRMTKLLQTIDKTITSMRGGVKMSNNDLYDALMQDHIEKYKDEVRERWGNTDAYKQSQQRLKQMSKEDLRRIGKESEELTKQLANSMSQDIKSATVQQLIEKHYQGINQFYDCSYEMYRNLGEMYVADKRFTAHYDKFKPGLAVWLRDAINYYCQQHQQ